ncbi:MAG: 50S ribosomal protein L4 [Acidobacteriota bacterium]|jgi:large subunit ribosomal protein L4
MPEVKIRNLSNQEVRSLELPEAVFGAPLKQHLLFQVVHHHMAEARRGTAATKTRGEVAGSGRKLWRQKKTGRARIGSIRSPLWRTGGTVHGPRPRSYGYSLPRKMRLGALRSAVSQRLREGGLTVVEKLDLEAPKTKEFVKMLAGLDLMDRSVLVLDEGPNRNLDLASRNLPRVSFLTTSQVGAYEVLAHQHLLMTEAAAARLGERLSG